METEGCGLDLPEGVTAPAVADLASRLHGVSASAASFFDVVAFRHRVRDKRRLVGHDILREVSISFDFVTEPLATCFLRPVKGRVLDGLELKGRTGEPLPLLTRAATQEVVGAILDEDLLLLLGDPPSSGPRADEARQFRQWMLAQVLWRPVEAFDRTGRDALQRDVAAMACDALNRLIPNSNMSRIGSLSTSIALSRTRDFLVATVPPEDSGILQYQHREVLAQTIEKSGASPGRIERTVALTAGAIPNRFKLPLYKAFECREYDLEMIVEEGSFFERLHVAGGSELEIRVNGEGSRYAHLVASARAPRSGGVPELAVITKENPGGSLFRALLLMAFTLIVLVVMGQTHPPVSTQGGTALEVAGTATAVLSGVVAAVWGVVRGTLAGRSLALDTLCFALVSAALLFCGFLLYSVPQSVSGLLSWRLLYAISVSLTFGAALQFGGRVLLLYRLRHVQPTPYPETPRA